MTPCLVPSRQTSHLDIIYTKIRQVLRLAVHQWKVCSHQGEKFTRNHDLCSSFITELQKFHNFGNLLEQTGLRSRSSFATIKN